MNKVGNYLSLIASLGFMAVIIAEQPFIQSRQPCNLQGIMRHQSVEDCIVLQ